MHVFAGYTIWSTLFNLSDFRSGCVRGSRHLASSWSINQMELSRCSGHFTATGLGYTYAHASTGFPGRIIAPRLVRGTCSVPGPGDKGRRLRGLRDTRTLHGRVGRRGRRGGRCRDTVFCGLPAGAGAGLAAGGLPPRPAGAGVCADTAGLLEGFAGGGEQRHQEGPRAVGHAERFLREDIFRGPHVLVARAGRLVSVCFRANPGGVDLVACPFLFLRYIRVVCV